MRLVLISDTHGLHRYVPPFSAGDILIHAGDITGRDDEHIVFDFIQWLDEQPFRHKIFIAGNHDFFFEGTSTQEMKWMLPEGVHYLCDSGIELEGFSFWGTPVTPRFFDWAFNRDRVREIAKHYRLFPKKVDVLITHGPPMGTLDESRPGFSVGCEDLKLAVTKLKPKLHIFGHIHECGGRSLVRGTTTFINAAVLDERYQIAFAAQTFEL